MSTLLLRLAGPLQSWGDSSRFTRRETRSEPTKSGVLGMVAAAQGRRRTDPLEDLLALRFGVRVDQPGRIERDFQTAHHPAREKAEPLSYRYYLADAVFVAGIEGDHTLLEGVADALQHPAYPLYLGRRSCPPAYGFRTKPAAGERRGGIVDGLVAEPLIPALRAHPWKAADWHKKRLAPTPTVRLDLVVDKDAADGEGADYTARDVPQSFSPERRMYGWREVTRLVGGARVANDQVHDSAEADYFAAVALAPPGKAEEG